MLARKHAVIERRAPVADARAAPDTGLEPITTRLPGELRQAVKLAAVRRRMSFQDVATQALSQWLERETRQEK
jgi:hypothetical protein